MLKDFGLFIESMSLFLTVFRRSTYNHLSSWLTDARNLTNPNTVSVVDLLYLKLATTLKDYAQCSTCCFCHNGQTQTNVG